MPYQKSVTQDLLNNLLFVINRYHHKNKSLNGQNPENNLSWAALPQSIQYNSCTEDSRNIKKDMVERL